LPLAIAAAGALLQYVRDTQKTALPHIRALRVETQRRAGARCRHAAQSQLDVSLTGGEDATLLAVLDAPPRPWVRAPCAAAGPADHATIALRERYPPSARSASRRFGPAIRIARGRDIERVLARVTLRSARPRDLVQLRNALAQLPHCAAAAAHRLAAARHAAPMSPIAETNTGCCRPLPSSQRFCATAT
jgi:DNA mismatch repair protein MutS